MDLGDWQLGKELAGSWHIAGWISFPTGQKLTETLICSLAPVLETASEINPAQRTSKSIERHRS